MVKYSIFSIFSFLFKETWLFLQSTKLIKLTKSIKKFFIKTSFHFVNSQFLS
ncbi:hypothetical protein RA0C_1315 [Riemerella anatipestifer ATCC 11845 = DSM 15868]|uniref:Uncharacterized protein n=1 Tax=Riemerella anatipestifer (strain ATCC 11845 / DSM 15868 / JCM 9532 / NCTC 11014) TaxID=693978 RepID=H8MAU4_RIEAD|nr:hypothetical protein RA0C_1315 [Riemerella anatipestifer ATCC 11845 = DSM 15868]